MNTKKQSAFFAATRPDELLSPADAMSMSGLEYMEKILHGEIPGAPIAAPMNIWLASVSEGRVVFDGEPHFETMNPFGTVHGGWYGTALDSAMGCAVMTTVPKGRTYTTLEFKVNIVRPIPAGTKIEAIATVQHAGRSTGVASGEIRGKEDGRLYATGSTTCIILDVPRPSSR